MKMAALCEAAGVVLRCIAALGSSRAAPNHHRFEGEKLKVPLALAQLFGSGIGFKVMLMESGHAPPPLT